MNKIANLVNDLLAGVKTFNFEDKQYSENEAVEVLRQALYAANGNSYDINRKAIRNNGAAIFTIIEEMVDLITNDGLKGNEFFMKYLDNINVKKGDKNEFWVPDHSTFVVAEVADGIATPRRQRIGKRTKVSVTTTIHEIRMYDEFSRFMAGRIDWNQLVKMVTDSFNQDIWNSIYATFKGITSSTVGLNSTYVQTGTWDEDTLLTLIGHVEAATGKKAVIVGTAPALRKIASSTLSNAGKERIENDGFVGMFYGTPEIAIPQVHKQGTDTFVMEDDAVYVIATDEKFIKFVQEGDTFISEKDQHANADMSIEYRVEMQYGTGIYFIEKSVGKYTIS